MSKRSFYLTVIFFVSMIILCRACEVNAQQPSPHSFIIWDQVTDEGEASALFVWQYEPDFPPDTTLDEWGEIGADYRYVAVRYFTDTASWNYAVGTLHGLSPVIGDCNCDGIVDITDLTIIVDYIFNGGPHPNCGQE